MTTGTSLKQKLFGRTAMAVQAGRQPAHQAASTTDARLATWMPTPGSADADLLPELQTLATRARDLARNSGMAGGYIRTAQDNIIGHQLRLSAIPDYALLGRDKAWAREWSVLTEAEFRTWAETPECDAGNTQTLWGLARLALASALVNGDHITLPIWLPRSGARWATRLQNVEADRLSTPPEKLNNPMIRGGVEIDSTGAPVAYHIQRNHPGDRYGLMHCELDQWERVPAFTPWGRRRVIHLHDKERSGQNRGAPIFTKVLREFKVSSEYVGNEVHASAANAMIAAFLETGDYAPDQIGELFGGDAAAVGANYANCDSYLSKVGNTFHRKQLESGLIMQLPPGTRLSSFNPARPNVAFGPFLEYITRYLSAGLNIPYELLLKDFSKTNYSSARAALLEAWRYFLSFRKLFTDQYLSAVYALWLEEAINLGRIEAPDYYLNPYAYARARWTFAGRGWVDPVKEANAAQIRIESGLSTLQIECAEQGQDWEEIAEQQAAEREYRESLGLPDPYATAGRGLVPQSEPDSSETETV